MTVHGADQRGRPKVVPVVDQQQGTQRTMVGKGRTRRAKGYDGCRGRTPPADMSGGKGSVCGGERGGGMVGGMQGTAGGQATTGARLPTLDATSRCAVQHRRLSV